MRFVTSESKTLHLKDGKNWIEVKNELSVGESKRYRASGFRHVSGLSSGPDDVKIEVDWKEVAFARAEAYIAGWSAPRPVTRAAIEALCEEDFEEIDGLIKKHIEGLEQAKKAKSQPSPSETSSIST